MTYHQQFENIISPERASLLCSALEVLWQRVNAPSHPAHALMGMEGTPHSIAFIKETALRLKQKFSTLLVLGTGGSTLCGQAMAGLKEHQPLYFLDNIDPERVTQLLNTLNLERTAFLIISKSGSTLETWCQSLFCLQYAAKRIPQTQLREQVFVVTDPGHNILREWAHEWSYTLFDHAPKIGGRFSILTNVGLLPAAWIGLDIDAFHSGAKAALKAPEQIIAGAAWHLLARDHMAAHVFMPYSDHMAAFARWYRQIWAESLGKNGEGSLLVNARGTLDQHSQLQLYLDGPRDKSFTLLFCEPKPDGDAFSSEFVPPSLGYLKGKSLGQVMQAEYHATGQTLAATGQSVRHFITHNINEAFIGQLAMHLMLETILVAEYLKIDAFNQPAVEEGKIMARQMLGA